MNKSHMAVESDIEVKKAGYKRILDLSVLVGAHVVLAPVFLILWTGIPTMVWLQDRGPVFYRQLRAGKNGAPFSLIKFRTMVPDADRCGPVWTTEDDPRITRVGKLLRRTGLDELPETINILKGQMSFVGPRALDVEEQKDLEGQIPGFHDRLMVRPGLTGLAQVYNATNNSVEKIRLDLEYIQNMSLVLDIKLLLLSVLNTLAGRWDRRSGKDGGEK